MKISLAYDVTATAFYFFYCHHDTTLTMWKQYQLKASSHKSAKPHAGGWF